MTRCEVCETTKSLKCCGLYPAYRIWNIAAHFDDFVDAELEKQQGAPHE